MHECKGSCHLFTLVGAFAVSAWRLKNTCCCRGHTALPCSPDFPLAATSQAYDQKLRLLQDERDKLIAERCVIMQQLQHLKDQSDEEKRRLAAEFKVGGGGPVLCDNIVGLVQGLVPESLGGEVLHIPSFLSCGRSLYLLPPPFAAFT